MARVPFLTLRVCSCRDLVHVRRQAQQIAELLSFRPTAAIGFAASTFVVAQQALQRLRRAKICFALADRGLHAFAAPARPDITSPADLLTVVRALPEGEQRMAAEDIPWALQQVQLMAPSTLEEELVRQNQDTIFLLSLLGEAATGEASNTNPSAA